MMVDQGLKAESLASWLLPYTKELICLCRGGDDGWRMTSGITYVHKALASSIDERALSLESHLSISTSAPGNAR